MSDEDRPAKADDDTSNKQESMWWSALDLVELIGWLLMGAVRLVAWVMAGILSSCG